MEVDLTVEASKFMLLGMGTVFVFLSVMVLAVNMQSKLVNKFFPDAPKEPETGSTKSNVNNKAAAVTAAIIHHSQAK